MIKVKSLKDKTWDSILKDLDSENWKNGEYMCIEIWKVDDKTSFSIGGGKKSIEKLRKMKWE